MRQVSDRTMAMVEAFVKSAVGNAGERAELLGRLAGRPEEKKRDRMLTTKEACELAGCHKKTIFNWEKAGKLHGKRISRSWVRWSRNEVAALVAAD